MRSSAADRGSAGHGVDSGRSDGLDQQAAAGFSAAPADEHPESRRLRVQRCQRSAGIFGALVTGIAVVAILGWVLDAPLLSTWGLSPIPLRANAALGLLCAGISLLLQREAPVPRRNTAKALAALTACIGAATLLEFLADALPGVADWRAATSLLQLLLPFPARMSPFSAFCLACYGVALLTLDSRKRGTQISQLATFAALIVGFTGFIGYLYDVVDLRRITSYSPLALPAALGYLLLGLGLCVARPEQGFVGLLVHESASAVLARRLVAAAVILPLAFGWLLIEGERDGVFGLALGAALNATLIMVLFIVLIGWAVGSLQRVEAERQRNAAVAAQLAAIVSSSSDAIFSKSLQGIITSWNPGAERLFGYSAAEMLGRTILRLVPPELHTEEARILAQIGTGKYIEQYETVRVTKAGCRLDVSLNISPIRDSAGNIVGASKIVRDITERKRAELALLAGDRRFRAIFNHQFQYSALLTPDGRIVEISDSVSRVTGIAPAKFIGRPYLDGPWYHDLPEKRMQLQQQFREALASPGPVRGEGPFRTGDGTLHYGLNIMTALRDEQGRVEYVLAEGIDITDRKQAEETLRQRAEEVERLLEVVPAAVQVAKDPACHCTVGNLRYNELFEVRTGASSATGTTAHFFTPEGRQLGPEELPMQVAASTNREVRDIELAVQLPSARTLFILGNAAPLRDDRGEVRGAIGAYVDITDRKRAEATIRESEERFRASFTHASIGFAMTGPDFQFLDVNPAYCQLTGFRREDLLARSGVELIHPDDLPANRVLVERMLAGEIPGFVVENRYLRKGGESIWVRKSVSLIRNADERPRWIITLVEDVTERKLAEQNLRRSERRYRLLHESLRDAYVQADLAGRILECNDLFCQLVGYSADELQTMTYQDLTPDHWHAAESAIVTDQVLARGYSEVYEKEYRRKNGSIVPIELRAILVLDPEGQAEGMWALVRDISERKQAEAALRASEERFRALTQAVPSLTCEADAEGANTFVSESWVAFTGMAPKAASGRGWIDTVHPDQRDEVARQWAEAVRSRTLFETRYRLRAASGSYRWHLVRGLPRFDANGRVVRWVGSCTDIEQIMQAQTALAEADRRKDEFLATLAHELRNPLAPLRSGVQVMRLARLGAERTQRLLESMDRQMTHLVRLVDDLLEISRITRDQIELRKERVAVASLVAQAVETSRPLIDASGHRLDVTLPPAPLWIEVDPTRLTQVLANLLNNAAKYTEPGGHIEVVAERHGTEAVIRVRDNGIGIPPELRDKVFDLFSQVDRRRNRSQGGLGIGLALVRRLVEMNGGRVTVQSEGEHRGSEFAVYLPLVEEIEEAAPAPALSASTGPGRRVLIADDNHDAADSLALLLEALGVQVQVAYSGPETLAALRSFRPDLILLDLGMPGMDGYETARQIRQRPEGDAMQVVALSGWGQDADREGTKRRGFDGHLVKPVALETLMTLIAELPEQH